jgi:hypothetical protein
VLIPCLITLLELQEALHAPTVSLSCVENFTQIVTDEDKKDEFKQTLREFKQDV